MLKAAAAAVLICVSIAGAAPAEARTCHNSHGKHFKCHKVLAPRVNLNARHPVKIVRCRGQVGHFNNC